MEINRERLVQTFCDLVAIDSPSLGERAMADELIKRLSALGFSVEEDDAGAHIGGSSGNIYAARSGSGELPPLLFCAHMDTVQPATGKKACLKSDGSIRSATDTVLGADDVSAIAAILEAVQTVLEKGSLQRDIEILFTVSEETYARGAAAFDYAKIRAKEAYVPDYEGRHGQAVVAAPTIAGFRAEITGKAAHAGFAPEQGVNAIDAAARAIGRLKQGRVEQGLTMNIGTIRGGLQTNIVPDFCEVAGEIRGYDHDAAMRQLSVVRDAFQAACDGAGAVLRFSSQCFVRSYRIPEDSNVVSRYFRVCGALGIPAGTVATFGGSDNNVLAAHGIQGIVIASAMHNCHSCAEYTSVDELTGLAELLVGIIRS